MRFSCESRSASSASSTLWPGCLLTSESPDRQWMPPSTWAPHRSKNTRKTRCLAVFLWAKSYERLGLQRGSTCARRRYRKPCCTALGPCLQCPLRPALADRGVGFGLQTTALRRGMLAPTGAEQGRLDMISVILVDDHQLVRTGFRLILAQCPDIEVVGEAASAEEGMRLIRNLKPDIAVVDVHMPGMSGIELTERVCRVKSSTRVVIATVMTDARFPKRLLDAGALGYLTKGCSADELITAIRQVAG